VRKITVRQGFINHGRRTLRRVEADGRRIGWLDCTDGIYRFIPSNGGFQRYFPTARRMREELSKDA
jgi:hypothetical protein